MSTEPLLATTVPTPAGELALVLTPEDGVVRVAGFQPLTDVVSRVPATLGARGVAVVVRADVEDPASLAAVVHAVERYAAGELPALDDA